MAEITTHRVERKPARSNTPRLITDEDVTIEGVEVVRATEAQPKPADAPRSRFASKSEE